MRVVRSSLYYGYRLLDKSLTCPEINIDAILTYCV